MSLQPIGGRETGLSWEGVTSILDYYIEPYVAPGYNNSQYGGMVTPEDPFGGSVDILPDSEPEPALTTGKIAGVPISNVMLIVGVAILALIARKGA